MTRTRLSIVIVVTAIASAAATGFAFRFARSGDHVLRAREGSLQSATLGEHRPYAVYLPAGYEADTASRYPVLYVLDGESQSEHAAESAALLARIGVIPPILVIGIPSIDRDKRTRDYTPPDVWRRSDGADRSDLGARRFLSFIQSELIPRIDAEYRTARPRMLAGWSRGGLFVLYSQISNASLFDGRFAHSPFVWGEEDDPAVTRFEQGLSAIGRDSSFLFLSLGAEEHQTMPQFRRAVRVLEGHAPPTLRWRTEVSPSGQHDSNPRLSTPVGLCAMFANTAAHSCRPLRL